MKTLQIGTACAQPGSRAYGYLELLPGPELVGVRLGVHMCNGIDDGPFFVLSGALHSTEINGAEVCRRTIQEIDPQRLNGAVVAIPVLNPLGARIKQTAWPSQGGFDALWGRVYQVTMTGDPQGYLPDRISALHGQRIFSLADYYVNFHSHSVCHGIMGMATKGGGSEELAAWFGAPYTRLSKHKFTFLPKSKTNFIVEELPPHYRFDEEVIRFGLNGVRNCLIGAGMIKGKMHYLRTCNIVDLESCESMYFTAETDGLWVSDFRPGDYVKEGQHIGDLYSLETYRPVQTAMAPFDGVITTLGMPWRVYGQGANEGADGNICNTRDTLVNISSVFRQISATN